MAPVSRDDLSINSIIGPGTSVQGDIEVAGFVRVDGALRGDLNSKGRIVIGEQARIRGDVTGTSVTVGGVVLGNVVAPDRVIVLSGAVLLGDVVSKRIQADEGCLIHGRILACGQDADWNSALSAYQDERSVTAVLRSDADRSDG